VLHCGHEEWEHLIEGCGCESWVDCACNASLEAHRESEGCPSD
jgi:hypothetical protein